MVTIKETTEKLIARYLGVENTPEEVKLKVLLDLYADAILLEAEIAEHVPASSILSLPSSDSKTSGDSKEAEQVTSITSISENPSRGAAGRAAASEAAALKRTLHAKLTEFRNVNGLGSFSQIVVASNGSLTDNDVRDMYEHKKVPIAKWRLLESALTQAMSANR